MLSETLTFYEPAERMPDSDLTVIVRLRNCEEPVWLGFHDGEEWRDVMGEPVEVVRWAELPEGGADHAARVRPEACTADCRWPDCTCGVRAVDGGQQG